MLILIGNEYCTVDTNGRFKFPSTLKKQLLSVIDNGFVIRESIFGPFLEMFPMSEWLIEIEKIKKRLNPYNDKDLILMRKLSQANKIDLDSNDRILIPNEQKKAAKITKDIVLITRINIIEIWDLEQYKKVNNIDMDFIAYANERIGKTDFE